MKPFNAVAIIVLFSIMISCKKNSIQEKQEKAISTKPSKQTSLLGSKWINKYEVEPGDMGTDTIIIVQPDTLKYVSANGPSGNLHYTIKKDSIFIDFAFELIDPCTQEDIKSRDKYCYVLEDDNLKPMYQEHHWPCDSSKLTRLKLDKSRLFKKHI